MSPERYLVWPLAIVGLLLLIVADDPLSKIISVIIIGLGFWIRLRKKSKGSKNTVKKQGIKGLNIPLNEKHELHYIDADQQQTERIILPKSTYTENGYKYIEGIDTSKNQIRTFRVDRIKMLVNLETGEIVIQ